MDKDRQYEAMEVCLLAGKLLLQSGAETYRIEDTMARIGNAFGLDHCECFVIPTGIIFSIGAHERQKTKLIRVSERTTDLLKITSVNRISRAISEGKMGIEEARRELEETGEAGFNYSVPMQVLAAALSSACFVIMFMGSWHDFIPAFIAGAAGYIGYLYFSWLVSAKFISEFFASVIIGLTSFLLAGAGLGVEVDKIIIGSVMPLVPGLLITNAVRDLIAGHLVSGISKGAEACLTAFAIGGGIAFVFAIF